MNMVRAGITFLIVLSIVLLAIFQMKIRGYEEVVRINEYVLYRNVDIVCTDSLYTIDAVEYRIECSSQFVLKTGLSEYTINEALEMEYITIDNVRDYIIISEE